MTIIEHLRELQKRIIHSVIFFCISFGISYWQSLKIYLFLAKPIIQYDKNIHFISTSLSETFFTYITLSFFVALIVSLPFFMLQFYIFAAPGLMRNEKISLAVLFGLFLTFLSFGFLVLYQYILPQAIDFLLDFQLNNDSKIKFSPKISEYIATVLYLFFAVGVAFQLPLILITLNYMKLITAHDLRRIRRYAVVSIFIIAAIVTPPDIMSQIIIGSIMVFMYEVTIIICRLLEKRSSTIK